MVWYDISISSIATYLQYKKTLVSTTPTYYYNKYTVAVWMKNVIYYDDNN